MLHCPHCDTEISLSEMNSQRLLRPRTCRECGGRFIEGGTTPSFAVIAAAGTLVTQFKDSSGWSPAGPMALLVLAGLATISLTNRSQPISSDRVRGVLLQGLLTVPLVSAGVLGLLACCGLQG